MKWIRLCPLLLALSLAACSQGEQVRAVPVDDAARPVGSGGPRLSSGFDRDLAELAAALPTMALNGSYLEVQELPTETLRVAETNVCRAGPGELSLPATEVLASRRPAAGHDQPESADVVAARARSEFAAGEFTDAAFDQMRACTERSIQGRDLGEGSYAPGEEATARSEDVVFEGWTGVRHTAEVKLTSNTWEDEVTREWVLVRQGQIVVAVRVEGADAGLVRAQTDSLTRSVTEVLDGRAAEAAALPVAGSGNSSGPTADSTADPTADPTPSPTGDVPPRSPRATSAPDQTGETPTGTGTGTGTASATGDAETT
ncbi:MAG: hypothetical protein Q4D18_11540, partial [Micrococcus sp.]|nr:hypothetical protein [Micrococcus sp.]